MRIFRVDRRAVYFELRYTRHVYWKPVFESVLHSYCRMENGKGFKFVNVTSLHLPKSHSFYFLCFKLSIANKEKKLCATPKKYVEFEKTHLQLLDLQEGNWND